MSLNGYLMLKENGIAGLVVVKPTGSEGGEALPSSSNAVTRAKYAVRRFSPPMLAGLDSANAEATTLDATSEDSDPPTKARYIL